MRSLLVAGCVLAMLWIMNLLVTHLPLGGQVVLRYLLLHPVFFALGIGCGLTNARHLSVTIAILAPIVLWPCTAEKVVAALTPMALGILLSRLVRLWMRSEVQS
jgi:hypothetical protein